MYNAWVLDLRAQPPTIMIHVQAKERYDLQLAVQAISDSLPASGCTIVTECNSAPLDIRDP